MDLGPLCCSGECRDTWRKTFFRVIIDFMDWFMVYVESPEYDIKLIPGSLEQGQYPEAPRVRVTTKKNLVNGVLKDTFERQLLLRGTCCVRML